MKIDGRCHCGYVTFEAEADPKTVTVCNCTDCQTMSGAPLRATYAVQQIALYSITPSARASSKCGMAINGACRQISGLR
jgi:hypothetical protein